MSEPGSDKVFKAAQAQLAAICEQSTAGTAAHMMSVFTELLRAKYSDKMDAQANSYIARAVQGGNRMQALIRDLLAYTRATGSEKPVSPAIFNNVLDRVLKNPDRALTAAGASVQKTAMPTLAVQEVHVEQLFQNLIGNAIKYRGAHPAVIRIVANGRPRPGSSRWQQLRDSIDAAQAKRIQSGSHHGNEETARNAGTPGTRPAVPEPLRADPEATRTSVDVPGEARSYAASYQVCELADL
jgi:light-regulated signal transduction histidine kinase (bacteriophytochrome)